MEQRQVNRLIKLTLASPSLNMAKKHSPIGWVFWDSRVGPHPSPVHQRPGPQDLSSCPLVAYAAQEGVVRQGVVRIPRNVDRLHRESVEHVEEAADVVRVRVANHDTVQRVDAPA